MVTVEFENKTKLLIDNLKGVCAAYGLGNDGNEFKIITQVFLYKFMNDKFTHEVKQIDSKFYIIEGMFIMLRYFKYSLFLFGRSPRKSGAGYPLLVLVPLRCTVG